MYLNEQTIDEVFDTLVVCAKEEGEDHVFTYMDKWYIESFIYGLGLLKRNVYSILTLKKNW